MGASLAQQVIEGHRVPVAGGGASGRAAPGSAVALRIDQVLMDEASAALTWLAFRSLERPRVAVESALTCAARDALHSGFDGAAEMLFAQHASARYGAAFGRFGCGPAHQVQLARFAVPGRTLLASERRAAVCGAVGMLSWPAGPIEIAAALAGTPYETSVPPVLAVDLVGSLPAWLGGQDVVLALWRILPAGALDGAVLEMVGGGVVSLSMGERVTVARLATELGALSALFLSDEVTRRFLKSEGREADWKPLAPDADAAYDRIAAVDLSALEPLVRLPGDAGVVPIRGAVGLPVGTVLIGSEASLEDLERLVSTLRGRTVSERLRLVVAVRQRAMLETAARCALMERLKAVGVRLVEAGDEEQGALEGATGPFLAFGLSLEAGRVSPHAAASRYVAGPEVCAASALAGVIADPRSLFVGEEVNLLPAGGEEPASITTGEIHAVNGALLWEPAVERGEPGELGNLSDSPISNERSLGPVPHGRPVEGPLRGVVLLAMGDNVTQDVVLPLGPRVLPLRSHIPRLAPFAFSGLDPGFAARARAQGGGVLVAGAGYGSGPDRPQAAMALAELGVCAVLARSFAPAHRHGLVLSGILPLLLASEADRAAIHLEDEVEIPDLPEGLEPHKPLVLRNLTCGTQLALRHDLAPREIARVRAGGLLRLARGESRVGAA